MQVTQCYIKYFNEREKREREIEREMRHFFNQLMHTFWKTYYDFLLDSESSW